MKDEAMKLAVKTDAVFAASIEFIGTLTGMKPPPIEIAPPEVLKPFNDFTEKVCAIFATTSPAQEFVCSTGLCHYRKPLTAREIELIDGMIEVQLAHAQRCDSIANRTMFTAA